MCVILIGQWNIWKILKQQPVRNREGVIKGVDKKHIITIDYASTVAPSKVYFGKELFRKALGYQLISRR